MAPSDADLWHQVHAQREDGVAAMFLIREVEPRPDQPQIFVIEMPYPITELSKLPDAAGYRRFETFQDQWIEPACDALDWTFVAWKCEDGAFFLYLYGAGDPNALLERLAPFDSALGFFNDRDADWSEYAALRELIDQAQAAEEEEDEGGHVHTEDCGHDHDHDHDAEATSHGISVVDLTGERAKGKAKPAKAKPAKAKGTPTAKAKAAKAKPAKARPAKAKPAKAKPAKAKGTKPTAKAKAAKAKPAKAKPAKVKAPAAKSKPAKPTSAKAKAQPKPAGVARRR